jgi:RNA polymerase sigma-B factor
MTISALERHPSRQLRKSETARLFAEIAEAVEAPDDQRRLDLIDEVIVANLGVAQAIARRFRRRGIPDDDLDQVAYVALTRAAQKFDPAQERDFLTYAVPTISGELKRHFRDHGWTVRPPRRIQEIQSRVIHAYKAGHESGSPPSAAKIATELDLPETDVREALSVDGCFAPTSLDQSVSNDTGELPLGLMLATDDDAELEALEARTVLAPALAKLSPRDRRILALRFVQEKTQLEIGEMLGVTQMQVSRLLRRILDDLRDELGPEAASA